MKNNKINTFFLVLFNLSLIAGFSYMLFTGVMEKALTQNDNLRPTERQIISISKMIPSINELPRQSTVRSKQKSSNEQHLLGSNLPTMNLDSYYGDRAESPRGSSSARGLLSSSTANKLIDVENGLLSHSSMIASATVYSGGRSGVSADAGSYSGNMPFTDGISTLPRSAPRTPSNTILIDPMNDPDEADRIPVGEGLGIMLLFAAAFAGKVYRGKLL